MAERRKKKRAAPQLLGAAERDLLKALAERTGYSPREVLARALSTWAAAIAPEQVKRLGKTLGPRAKKPTAQRLFLSIDGAPEQEVRREAVLGRDPACDVRIDLPLISARHARLLLRDGRWLFEDLRSERGSFKGGQRIEVAFLVSGDEIDLGGFLPLRFRVG